MRKRTVYFFIIIGLVLAACNNEKAAGNAPVSTTLPAVEQQLKDAIKQYPDSLLLKENLLQYYADNGNYTAGLKEIDQALLKDSLNPRLWDIRATLHFENGDTSNAIRDFEQAVKIFPNPEYMISLGALYAQTKNILALKVADELQNVSKGKADQQAFFIKGLYHTFSNEKMKAINFFDKCLALNHTFMDAYREKAIALYDLGEYDDALTVLDKALTLQNNYDEGYYYSGKCLEKLNRIPEAIQSYQNALKLSPDYVEPRDALGKLGVKS
ncbi:MAG: tetratricopeptide repeat protein [Ferruginibacter sp.]